MPMPDSESVFVIPGSVLLWRIAPRPPNSAQVRLRLRTRPRCPRSAPRLLFPRVQALLAECRGEGSQQAPGVPRGLGVQFPLTLTLRARTLCGHPPCLAGQRCWDGAGDSLGGALASFSAVDAASWVRQGMISMTNEERTLTVLIGLPHLAATRGVCSVRPASRCLRADAHRRVPVRSGPLRRPRVPWGR